VASSKRTEKHDERHDKARGLAEEALRKASEGNIEEGRRLAREAAELDFGAVEEVAAEVEAERRAAARAQRQDESEPEADIEAEDESGERR
jgi:hypothetical protein